MVEVNLERKFSSGKWEKGAAIKDYVIIVEKVGIWPNLVMCVRSPVGSGGGGGGGGGMCPSKYEIAIKTDKKEERNYIHTNC